MTYRPPLQFSDADFQRCYASVHEAGHAVAAVLLGGTVHLATVDGQPRTEYDVLPDGARAAVAYAGPGPRPDSRPGAGPASPTLNGSCAPTHPTIRRCVQQAGQRRPAVSPPCWSGICRR